MFENKYGDTRKSIIIVKTNERFVQRRLAQLASQFSSIYVLWTRLYDCAPFWRSQKFTVQRKINFSRVSNRWNMTVHVGPKIYIRLRSLDLAVQDKVQRISPTWSGFLWPAVRDERELKQHATRLCGSRSAEGGAEMDGATENASTENESTGGWNMQVRKKQVQICNGGKRKYSNLKEYFEEFTIFQSCIFSRSAVSRSRPVHLCCARPVLYTRNRTHDGLMRCQVTVLSKLFTPIVPLFIKQRKW